MKKYAALILFILGIGLNSSCRREADESETQAPREISEETRHGPVSARLTLAPAEVNLDRHMILTLSVTHPEDIQVQLPPIGDRAKGFAAGHSFEKSAKDPDGNTVLEKVTRLTPRVAKEYRIAPMAIVYYTSSTSGQKKNWFPTPSLRIDFTPPEVEGASFKEEIDPVWVRPSAAELGLYVLAVILAAALLLLAVKLIKKLLTYVRLMRMSPRERALEELRMLLEKDLVSKHLVKEFYLELTMIVRMFIERGYGIRAPEQTTEEFLESAGKDDRFRPKVLNKLRSFLQSADLVKFAGFTPDPESTNAAINGAKEFIRVESSENPDAGRKQEVTDA